MTDFHHNIFYYYRGVKQDDLMFERQIENNTTKALINTLEYCSSGVSNKFLDWLGIHNEGEIRYLLQTKSIGEAKIYGKTQKVLLGLCPTETQIELDIQNMPSKGYSVPDAWIYGDNFVILIESKVVGDFNSDQLEKHKNILRGNLSLEPQFIIKKWSDIHFFFNELLPNVNRRDYWLIKQFTQYLEWINMTEFTGFNTEIFDYFITHEDKDLRKWVKVNMQSFGEKLQSRLFKIDPFYNGFDLGRLGKKSESSWIGLGPKNKEYRKKAHLTVGISSNGLEVFINVELKSATDRLKVTIKNHKEKFRDHLRKINIIGPIFIQIEDKKQKQAMLYNYNLITRIDVDSLKHTEIGISSFEYLETLVEKLNIPCFSIRKLFGREEVYKISNKDQGDFLLSELSRICEAFNPIVRFLNE